MEATGPPPSSPPPRECTREQGEGGSPKAPGNGSLGRVDVGQARDLGLCRQVWAWKWEGLRDRGVGLEEGGGAFVCSLCSVTSLDQSCPRHRGLSLTQAPGWRKAGGSGGLSSGLEPKK